MPKYKLYTTTIAIPAGGQFLIDLETDTVVVPETTTKTQTPAKQYPKRHKKATNANVLTRQPGRAFYVLLHLNRWATAIEVAKFLSDKEGSVSSALSSLHTRSIVARRKSGRSYLYQPTEYGKELFAKIGPICFETEGLPIPVLPKIKLMRQLVLTNDQSA